jgi:hypothetical protein
MILNTEKGCFHGEMEENMREYGCRGNKKVLAFITCPMERKNMGNGKTE